ncbi:MAG: sulfate reduction electron transfer complex DsrMKJOP subunit DsrM [Deltaproteobacteria bacterium]|nr:sulfate reduction electron transfer complex DsrMKJOP subunit DsrM [Deltaproteobacteria bacterium]
MDFCKRQFTAALIAVLGLIAVAYVGVKAHLQPLFGVVIPYLALLLFFEGIIYRVIKWARSPVPFRIPTTASQHQSHPWIKRNLGEKLDNPSTFPYTVGRMALEILAFRSLFRNLRSELIETPQRPEGAKLVYWSYKWLWLGAIAFHYAFLTVVLRHLRFFTDPVPQVINKLAEVDGFVQFFVPTVYLSGVVLVVALLYLLGRRLTNPYLRYISLASDYFPLFLILGIGTTGILMRYVYRVDITKVKELALGLATLNPVIPEGIGTLFYIHLFLVCVLLAYFPFSKLLHAPGVFLSPTRNLTSNSRMVMHINPWNYPVKFHTYMDQENEYREAMYEAGIPVEIEPETAEETEPETTETEGEE